MHLDLKQAVKCSNFIGETLDLVCEIGFRGALLIGHVGKLVKLAGGMMNTHSVTGTAAWKNLAAHTGLCPQSTPSLVKPGASKQHHGRSPGAFGSSQYSCSSDGIHRQSDSSTIGSSGSGSHSGGGDSIFQSARTAGTNGGGGSSDHLFPHNLK